jgi:hypothetical protein
VLLVPQNGLSSLLRFGIWLIFFFTQAENQQLNQQLQQASDELEKGKIKYQEALDSWQQNKQRLQVTRHNCPFARAYT